MVRFFQVDFIVDQSLAAILKTCCFAFLTFLLLLLLRILLLLLLQLHLSLVCLFLSHNAQNRTQQSITHLFTAKALQFFNDKPQAHLPKVTFNPKNLVAFFVG